MLSTRYKGVIGEIMFDAKGDLKHGVISLYHYNAGKKLVLDVVEM
jgi:branched-chain amino acid transport system substrate-binding protein